MAIGSHRVQVDKHESSAGGGDEGDLGVFGGPTPIEPQEDAIEAAGVYLQDASNRDEAVFIERDGDDLRFRDENNTAPVTLTQLLDTLWQRVSAHLESLTDGDSVRLWDATRTHWAIFSRSSGNLSISVGTSGTDAQALYLNCKRGVYQLGGTSASEFFRVEDGGTGLLFEVLADQLTRVNHTLELLSDAPDPSTQGQLKYSGSAFRMQDSLGVFNPREGVMTDEQHRQIDQLTHDIDETSYYEPTYSSGLLRQEGWWDDALKTTPIRVISYSYTGPRITTEEQKQYDGSGVLVETMTGTYTYSGARIDHVDWVRT